MAKLAKLQSTSDYSKFLRSAFNREVKKTEYLRQSMKKNGYIQAYPLHVEKRDDGKLVIIGGHHRFEVAKELQIPVWYVIVEGIDVTIHELERATNQWTMRDYLHSFCALGLEPYSVVRQFHERTGISLSLCIAMIGGDTGNTSNQRDRFKAGTYKVKDMEHAEMVGDITIFMRELNIEFATNTRFTAALSKTCRYEGFDPTQFKKRVASNVALMINQPNIEMYQQLIEDIYNRRQSKENRIPLKMLADQAVARRNAIEKKKADRDARWEQRKFSD